MPSFNLIFQTVPPVFGTAPFYERFANITKSLKNIPYMDSQATCVMDCVTATTCSSVPPFSPTSSTSAWCHCFYQTFPVLPPGTTTNTWQLHHTKWRGVHVEAGENRAVLPLCWYLVLSSQWEKFSGRLLSVSSFPRTQAGVHISLGLRTDGKLVL